MPKPESRLKPVRAHLGQMSRLLRFAEQMDIKRRSEQADGMRRSARRHQLAAATLLAQLPTVIQNLLSEEEVTSLRSFVPLPHSKRNRVIKQFVDYTVYRDGDSALQQKVDELRQLLEKVQSARTQCDTQLATCNALTSSQRTQLEQLSSTLQTRAESYTQQLATLERQFANYQAQNSPQALQTLERECETKIDEWTQRYRNALRERQQMMLQLEQLQQEREQLSTQNAAIQQAFTKMLSDFVPAEQQAAYLQQLIRD